MEEKSNTQSHSVRGIEIFGHAIGGVGQNMVYALWSGFITAFYTDIFGMNPAVMATIFVVARVWEAFNDTMMGILADRTRSKYGRYRCWLLRMPVVVATCLVLNFTVPNFGNVGNIVYAVVTYILMGMAFTSVDIPYWSMPAAMTSDPNERTKIFTTANLGTNIASTVGNMLIPILLVNFGGTNSAHAYFVTAVIFAVIGVALYLTCFALTREHVQPSTQKFSFRLAMKSLAVNKPLFCIMITNLVINLAFIMKMTLNYYYTTYTLGNVKLMSVMSLVTLPSIIIGTCIAPLLAKKLGKKRTVLALMVANLIISGIFFVGGYSKIPFVLVMGRFRFYALEPHLLC